MTDTKHRRINSLAGKARSALSNAGQDDHVKQAAVVAKDTCPVSDYGGLVAQHLAGAPFGGPPAQAASIRPSTRTVARRLANHAVPDAVSAGVTLAVHLHPQEQADAFHSLNQDLGTLRAQSDRVYAPSREVTK